MITEHQYFTYIITTRNVKLLYVGITNNLKRRLLEHISGHHGGYTQRYQCHFLLYYEEFKYVDKAIKREKELKGWSKKKKFALIRIKNPQLEFLNDKILSQ
jgi:putative endonuclease